MTQYPNIIGPGKNPLLPGDFLGPPINPWFTDTLKDSFKQYNNAIEVNYLAFALALTEICNILVDHIGDTNLVGNNSGNNGSSPLSSSEKAAITAAIASIGVGTEDEDLSPGGPLRPALSGAKLTTQTIEDLTTGFTSINTFSSML